MKNNSVAVKTEKRYSRIFSSLFCSMAILALSALCLLNNLTIDLYSTIMLLKIVIPAAFCFWILGYIIGYILDTQQGNIKKRHDKQVREAYELPSMFMPEPGLPAETEEI